MCSLIEARLRSTYLINKLSLNIYVLKLIKFSNQVQTTNKDLFGKISLGLLHTFFWLFSLNSHEIRAIFYITFFVSMRGIEKV